MLAAKRSAARCLPPFIASSDTDSCPTPRQLFVADSHSKDTALFPRIFQFYFTFSREFLFGVFFPPCVQIQKRMEMKKMKVADGEMLSCCRGGEVTASVERTSAVPLEVVKGTGRRSFVPPSFSPQCRAVQRVQPSPTLV